MALTDELEELKRLHESGALTTEAFERARDEAIRAQTVPTGPGQDSDWHVAEGHDPECTCFTCVRINCT